MKKIFILVLLLVLAAGLVFGQATRRAYDYVYVRAINGGAVSFEFPDIDFGYWYSGSVREPTAVVEFAVKVPSGTPFHVSLNAGLNYSSGYRRMESSVTDGVFVSYRVFKPGGLSWGDTHTGDNHGNTYPASCYSGTGSGTPDHWTGSAILYPLTAPETAPTGYYYDTLLASLWY
jgi:spore coat protein U-like protein